MARATVKVHEDEYSRFLTAVGFGLMNFGHAVESDAKADAPVRGGHRSFLTSKRTKAGARGDVAIGSNNGSVLIGGTLRRSIHTAAFANGEQIGTSSDENGRGIPVYTVSGKAAVVIGTNCDYGAYVEIGTTRMEARPFLGPAFDANLGRLASLVRAGMKAKGYK